MITASPTWMPVNPGEATPTVRMGCFFQYVALRFPSVTFAAEFRSEFDFQLVLTR